MAGDSRDGDANFLRRWSQRKLAAARPATAQTSDAPATGSTDASVLARPEGAAPSAQPVAATETPPTPGMDAAPAAPRDEGAGLPPVESLGFDSDFTRFLAPKVDEALKRKALRKLFSDPRFNVMDGLDVYIDDYSKFEPIPEDLLGKLRHARYVFDPPKTRVNEAGHVEDVPDEPRADAAAVAEGDSGGTATEGAVPPPPATATDAGPAAEAALPERSERSVVDGKATPDAKEVDERDGKR